MAEMVGLGADGVLSHSIYFSSRGNGSVASSWDCVETVWKGKLRRWEEPSVRVDC